MNIRVFFLFLIMLFAASMPAQAQLGGVSLNVPATLMAETATPAPGKLVTVAFVMRPKSGWHGYWENPGDAGVGMQLKWDLPKGVTAGPLRYPVPTTLIISGLMNHVYEEPFTLLVDLKLDGAIAAGTKIPVRVRGDWLACTDSICVPEGDDLAIDLVVGDGMIAAYNRTIFDGYRAAIPVPLDQAGRYAIKGNRIEIAIPYPASALLEKPYFFPLTSGLFAYAAPQKARRVGDWLIVEAGVTGDSDIEISGLLRIGEAQGLNITALPSAVPVGGTPIATLGQGGVSGKSSISGVNGSITGFGWILGFAFLGGMLLNLMPCVFPILGLKALALAKMGGEPRAAKVDALAYSAGVVLSCLALGAVMLLLRAGGEQVGWAFQLQEPPIVALLFLLMVAVTANLFGLFDIASVNVGNKLAVQSGFAGSFWTGVLAAIVATPCTGPFMAAALGAALLLPPLPALLLFAGLGFGLALPYLAIAYLPPLRRLLPKPGPWLVRLRKWMALPMGLTALALLWLLWRLSGIVGLLFATVAGLLAIALLFTIGKRQARGSASAYLFIVLGALGVATFTGIPSDPVSRDNETQSGLIKTEPFSPELLAQYRAAGKPVFVYFTADWCVTCKVNEAAAIQREATANAFAKAQLKVLEGDFTRRDPAMARVLESHGRSGVPLYLYYGKGGEAQILPQILTPEILVEMASGTLDSG